MTTAPRVTCHKVSVWSGTEVVNKLGQHDLQEQQGLALALGRVDSTVQSCLSYLTSKAHITLRIFVQALLSTCVS